jgi:copper chaperone
MAMTTATYTISGMTCDHCVRSVSGELARLPGVTAVEVDLGAGTAIVTSDTPLDPAAVRVAIDEAGYELVG